MKKGPTTHLIIYSMYYYPEKIGIGAFNHEMADFLKKCGYCVTVVTAMPWYPDWNVAPEYRGLFFSSEIINDISVRRSFVFPPKKVNAISRIMHEALFAITSSFNLFFLLFKRVDALIVVCPPLAIGLPALFFSRLKRTPMIFHVQDLQVDAAKELKFLKNSFFLKILENFEKFLFKNATFVSTITEGMKKKIVEKGIREERIFLLPNWADVHFVKPLAKNNEFRVKNGISPESFVILYAGNIGTKQGVEIVLDVARMSRHDEDVQYFIVGEGAGLVLLTESLKNQNLKNVHLLPLQPKDQLPWMLAAADVSLVIQKRSVGDFLMPSKLLNIMASARPVIASADASCSLARLIEAVQCGIVTEAENAVLLYNAIIELCHDRKRAEVYGQNGRRYAEEHLSKEVVLNDLDKNLVKLLDGSYRREASLC